MNLHVFNTLLNQIWGGGGGGRLNRSFNIVESVKNVESLLKVCWSNVEILMRSYPKRSVQSFPFPSILLHSFAFACAEIIFANILWRVLLGLFRNRNTRNRRYLCSFGSSSVFDRKERNIILFILLPIAE